MVQTDLPFTVHSFSSSYLSIAANESEILHIHRKLHMTLHLVGKKFELIGYLFLGLCGSNIIDQISEICSHTGLLIQRMSALSVRVSSGPKSVMGWASTRELCFLFSMLGLAVL